MANDDPKLTAFSVRSLAFVWLGMLAFGFVNFFVFALGERNAGMLAGSIYLVASLGLAGLLYVAGVRAFATGMMLGFTIMTLVDGSCTLFVPARFGFLDGSNGFVLYVGALFIGGLLVFVRAAFFE